jgi:UDP-2,3-diacylglucosamine pyrophosphatase LpxH
MNSPQTFQELYVVSDLHLGGQGGERQIFNQGAAFAGLIDELLHRHLVESQGLVINGDLVDFLAEPDARYFDPAGALGKLDRIIHDPSFVPVWDALRSFLKPDNRHLIITLGNHDLELAFGWVQDHLRSELTRDCPTARDRVQLVFQKWGYNCRVGNASVRCAHGNEVDSWNVTDYAALERVTSGASRDWTPNAGTQLVIDVMNGIKRDYPFVDLLKPETAGVLPTLAVLEPSLAGELVAAGPAGYRLSIDSLRRQLGMLGQQALDPACVDPSLPLVQQMLGGTLGPAVAWQKDRYDLDALLLETEKAYLKKTKPLDLVYRMTGPDMLGFWSAVKNVVLFRGKEEVLRESLEGLMKDKSFDLGAPDDTFRDMTAQAPGDPDFLTAGHTHLARALSVEGTGRYYLNSGTWVRLIQLTSDMLATKEAFQPVYDALAAGNMKGLDEQDGLVLNRCSVVRFWADDTKTYGALYRINKDAKLEAEPRIPFVKG